MNQMCECLATCPFFNDKMANKPATADMMKDTYCRKDYESCARYIVFQAHGTQKVPADLFPHQMDKARKLLG